MKTLTVLFMKLRVKQIQCITGQCPEVKELFNSAFPQCERIPYWLLCLFALRKKVHLLAFYDDEAFVGLMLAYDHSSYFYIAYLAVNPKIRSKGYGGAILNFAFEMADSKPLVLEVELPEQNAENLEQRNRRISFYKKHGIYDSGFRYSDKGVTYAILTSDTVNFSATKFKKLLRDFYLGCFKKKLEKF